LRQEVARFFGAGEAQGFLGMRFADGGGLVQGLPLQLQLVARRVELCGQRLGLRVRRLGLLLRLREAHRQLRRHGHQRRLAPFPVAAGCRQEQARVAAAAAGAPREAPSA
jgi:hypothetical protein